MTSRRLRPEHREGLLALEQMLEAERVALVNADYDRLQSLSEEKIRLLGWLEKILGEEFSGDDVLAGDTDWKQFLGALAEARQKNRENGALISRMQDFVREALAVLRGTDGDSAYDAHGSADQACIKSHTLGRA